MPQLLPSRYYFLCLLMVVVMCGCATAGSSSTPITGAAGGGASIGASSQLERCVEPLGVLTIDDGRRFNKDVSTVEPLVRLAIAQSNCFVISAVGNIRTDERMQRVTDIQRDSGEYRAGSNQQKGQRVAADYYLEPSIIINNDTTGGLGAAVKGLIGDSIVGRVAGSMESKSSVVTLALYDMRSSLQLSISEGSSSSTNFGAALGAFGNTAGGSLGGYSKTPEGKATVAAFLDAYNKMVISLRNYKAQDVKGGMGTGGLLKVN